MFLYDQKKNSFDIYEMKEKESEIVEYRKREMEFGEYDIKCFHSKVGYFSQTKILSEGNLREELVSKILSQYDFEILIEELLMVPTFTIRSQNSLLNQYYNGSFIESSIARFNTENGIRNFLMTQEQYEKRGPYYYLEDILELPESLYILQRIEQGEFKQLNEKEINEQLALFTLSKINEVSMQELQKMDVCGITENAVLKVRDKAKKDAYVLRLMKK